MLAFERLTFLKRTAVDPLASHKSPLTATGRKAHPGYVVMKP